MQHDTRLFGNRADRAGWYLRAQQQRRKEARRAAIFCAAVTVACAFGAGLADRFGNDGGAILLGLFAFGALLTGTAAAGEA